VNIMQQLNAESGCFSNPEPARQNSRRSGAKAGATRRAIVEPAGHAYVSITGRIKDMIIRGGENIVTDA